MKLKRRDGPPPPPKQLHRHATPDEVEWLAAMERGLAWEWQFVREWLRMLIILRSDLT